MVLVNSIQRVKLKSKIGLEVKKLLKFDKELIYRALGAPKADPSSADPEDRILVIDTVSQSKKIPFKSLKFDIN